MDALDGNAIALFCKCRCIAGKFEALAHDPVQDQLAFHELRSRQRALVGLRVEQIGWEVHLDDACPVGIADLVEEAGIGAIQTVVDIPILLYHETSR